MSNLTVEDIKKPDEIASSILAFYDVDEQGKHGVVQQWNEVRKYIFATDTTHTTSPSTPWKNRTTRPKLTWIHDKLRTEYIRNLIPSDKFFRWQGSPKSVNKQKAVAIEHYMVHKTRHPVVRFRETVAQCLEDFIDFGNAFAGVEYVVKRQKSLRTGQTRITFKGARPFRISPYDVCIDPTADRFEESYFARKSIIRFPTFLGMVQSNPDKYREEAVEKVKAVRQRNLPENLVEAIKDQNRMIDGLGLLDHWKTNKIELIEYYGDIYDTETGEYLRNKHVVIADRMFTVVLRDNPTNTGTKPVVHAGWRKRPDNLYAMGPLENLLGLQYRIDHLENAKSDAIDYCTYPIRKITGDASDSDYPLQPGAKWYVPLQGDVELLYPDPRVVMFESPIMSYEREMEEYAGVPRETAGFRTPGEKTKFEVDQLLSHADNHFAEKLLQFEDEFIEPLLNLMFELNMMNIDESELESIPPEDVEAWKKITIDDLKQDGRLYPIGSKHFKHRQTKMAKIQEIMGLGAQLSPEHIDKYLAMKSLEEEAGLEDSGIVAFGAMLEEQVKLQQKQQELQDAVKRGGQGAPIQ